MFVPGEDCLPSGLLSWDRGSACESDCLILYLNIYIKTVLKTDTTEVNAIAHLKRDRQCSWNKQFEIISKPFSFSMTAFPSPPYSFLLPCYCPKSTWTIKIVTAYQVLNDQHLFGHLREPISIFPRKSESLSLHRVASIRSFAHPTDRHVENVRARLNERIVWEINLTHKESFPSIVVSAKDPTFSNLTKNNDLPGEISRSPLHETHVSK